MSDAEFDRLVEAHKQGKAAGDTSEVRAAELDVRFSKSGLGAAAIGGEHGIIGWEDPASDAFYGDPAADATERGPELAASSGIIGYLAADEDPAPAIEPALSVAPAEPPASDDGQRDSADQP